jgi:membrane associated rhomboid family serine protease
MFQLTPVIKNIIIINVLIYFSIQLNLLSMIPDVEEYFVLKPYNNGFKPYQIFTSMFMHGSPQHLLFNMLGLVFLGPNVESSLGSKKFLNLYMLSGIASGIAHLALVNSSAVGASGAIYGMLGAFAAMFPNLKLIVFPIPIPIKAIFLIGGYIAYDLFSGLTDRATGIAHFAHVGGAVMGIALIFYWGKQKQY